MYSASAFLPDDVVDGAAVGHAVEEFFLGNVDDQGRDPHFCRLVERAVIQHVREVRRAFQVGNLVDALRNRIDRAARFVDGALAGESFRFGAPTADPLIAHLADDGRDPVVAGANMDDVAA